MALKMTAGGACSDLLLKHSLTRGATEAPKTGSWDLAKLTEVRRLSCCQQVLLFAFTLPHPTKFLREGPRGLANFKLLEAADNRSKRV